MEPVYNEILNFLKLHEDFDFHGYKSSMLVRRIQNRITRTGTENPEQYLQYLSAYTAEPKELRNNFLINVSHFFRNSLMFEYLKTCVIPDLISQKKEKGEMLLRIWSAGCACGEEAYTLAILIHDYCEKEKIEISIDFFATDYDDNALIEAQKGVYKYESIKELKVDYLDRYFIKSGDRYEVSSTIKSMVKFSNYNLLDKTNYVPSESIFGNFDIVLCRNVLIYFNQAYQKKIFSKLHKALSPTGVLVLGDAEVPMNEYKKKFSRLNNCCTIFRKR